MEALVQARVRGGPKPEAKVVVLLGLVMMIRVLGKILALLLLLVLVLELELLLVVVVVVVVVREGGQDVGGVELSLKRATSGGRC